MICCSSTVSQIGSSSSQAAKRRKQHTYKVYVFFKDSPGRTGEDQATRQSSADQFLRFLIGVIGEEHQVDSPDLALLKSRQNVAGVRIATINLNDLPPSGFRGVAQRVSGSRYFTSGPLVHFWFTFASLWFTCCSLLVHFEPKVNQK